MKACLNEISIESVAWAEQIALLWVSIIQSKNDWGYLGCFHVLAIVKSAAMNIRVHVSFWIIVFSGYMPSSGLAESYDSSIFSLLRNQGSQTEWSKSEREKQILYISAYMWNLEKWYRWTYLQGRNRDADRERICGHSGEKKGMGWVGRLDWHIYMPCIYHDIYLHTSYLFYTMCKIES